MWKRDLAIVFAVGLATALGASLTMRPAAVTAVGKAQPKPPGTMMNIGAVKLTATIEQATYNKVKTNRLVLHAVNNGTKSATVDCTLNLSTVNLGMMRLSRSRPLRTQSSSKVIWTKNCKIALKPGETKEIQQRCDGAGGMTTLSIRSGKQTMALFVPTILPNGQVIHGTTAGRIQTQRATPNGGPNGSPNGINFFVISETTIDEGAVVLVMPGEKTLNP